MRPTRRGLGLVSIVALAIVASAEGGARTLDAVVVPLVVAAVGAVLTVALSGRPTVDRRPVRPGHPGDRRTVELRVSGARWTNATVVDAVGDGLDAADTTARVTLEAETEVTYPVTLDRRGERWVGPTTVVVTDLFGLCARRFEVDQREPVVVYPPVYALEPAGRRLLATAVGDAREYAREAFDHLREYQRGDPLRDVHWKSVARRPDDELVVTEFAADRAVRRVTLAATAAAGHADEMARAAATVVEYLLAQGVAVELYTPGGRRASAPAGVVRRPSDERAGPASAGRHALLRALALAEAGDVDDRRRRDADVRIAADDEGTTVAVGETTVPFERIRADPAGDDASTASVGSVDGPAGRADGRVDGATGRSDVVVDRSGGADGSDEGSTDAGDDSEVVA